jgi:Domain of unknown function (DUF3598)
MTSELNIESEPQWDCMLQNVGEWVGSFTRFTLDGTPISDIPSHLKLEDLGDHQARLTLTRQSPDYPEPLVQEFATIDSSTLFADSGAFSQGSIQFSPGVPFGAEFGHVCGDRRLRLVQLFTPDGQPKFITLIQEKRSGTAATFADVLTIDDLLGTWKGESVTIYPDLRKPERFISNLKITQTHEHMIQQSLDFGKHKIISNGRLEGQQIVFEQGSIKSQVLRLPDRASVRFPAKMAKGVPAVFECAWMPESNVRHRLIRTYDPKGIWVSFTQVIEQKL